MYSTGFCSFLGTQMCKTSNPSYTSKLQTFHILHILHIKIDGDLEQKRVMNQIYEACCSYGGPYGGRHTTKRIIDYYGPTAYGHTTKHTADATELGLLSLKV